MENVQINPEICVHDARRAIAFYEKAFGAKSVALYATPDEKKVMHCCLELNGAAVFVCDDFPEASRGKRRSPKALGGSSVTVHLNCADVARSWKSAVRAGAKVVLPLERQFWGDVYGVLVDPFGQRWSLSSSRSGEKPESEDADYAAGAEKMYPTKKKGARGAQRPAARRKAGARRK